MSVAYGHLVFFAESLAVLFYDKDPREDQSIEKGTGNTVLGGGGNGPTQYSCFTVFLHRI